MHLLVEKVINNFPHPYGMQDAENSLLSKRTVRGNFIMA
jgi:hypothetical protein